MSKASATKTPRARPLPQPDDTPTSSDPSTSNLHLPSRPPTHSSRSRPALRGHALPPPSTPPAVSQPDTHHPRTMPLDTSAYSLALLRVDGRRWNELRRVHAQIRTQAAADGSSYLEMGHTKVMCVVTGPSEPGARRGGTTGGAGGGGNNAAEVSVTVVVAGFSSVDRKRRGRGDKCVPPFPSLLPHTPTDMSTHPDATLSSSRPSPTPSAPACTRTSTRTAPSPSLSTSSRRTARCSRRSSTRRRSPASTPASP